MKLKNWKMLYKSDIRQKLSAKIYILPQKLCGVVRLCMATKKSWELDAFLNELVALKVPIAIL